MKKEDLEIGKTYQVIGRPDCWYELLSNNLGEWTIRSPKGNIHKIMEQSLLDYYEPKNETR